MHSHLKANTDLIRQMCLNAQREGNDKQIKWCLRMAADADPTRQISDQLTKVAIILGGGYLAVRFGLPFVLDLIEGRKARPRLEAGY
jgi:hypothetical protein